MASPVSSPNPDPSLQIAWQHQAEFDLNANIAARRHLRLRGWVIILGVVATLLAILTDLFADSPLFLQRVFDWSLIIVPIVGSAVLAFANKFQQGEHWLVLRTAAEEIKKEIYLYRTLLQGQEERHHWLNERVATIQRQVLESVGDNLVLKPYQGPIPPYFNPAEPASDPGFADLLAEDYLRYRLNDQLNWHTNRLVALEKNRLQLQIAIFAFSGLGTLLAAAGANLAGFSHLSLWVALTSAIAVALTSWLELRRADSTINNYNQVILELTIIRDHWASLPPKERSGAEFFKLVTAGERVLWSQHTQYVTEMRQAVADLKREGHDVVATVLQRPVPAAIDEALLAQSRLAQAVAAAESEAKAVEVQAAAEAEVDRSSLFVGPRGVPHAFVVMPFGQKKDTEGNWLDFDRIYYDLIKPALIEAGFEPFRADEESVSGDILTDMFQELLLADLVLADLSIDNANVFYELGVRHSLRQRGIIHIRSGRNYLPFDIFNVRTIPYSCDKRGKPDPKQLEKDKQAIIKVAKETWASSQERVHSPIFNLLDGLQEPDRRTLHTPLATGYWREYNEWQTRVTVARRQRRLGDILLLTEEVSNPLLQESAIEEAGRALKSLGEHALALQQYQRGLKLNSKNTVFRREEAFHLARLNQNDEAIVKLEGLLAEVPADIEAISYLGRIYKEMWLQEWDLQPEAADRIKGAFGAAYLLKRAIDTYLQGYSLDQNHFYSGINALVLSKIMEHLTEHCGDAVDNPEILAIKTQLAVLTGAVQFSLENAAKRDPNNYWVFASLGDLAVCMAETPQAVGRAYKKALALGGKNRFSLQSTLSQLTLLEALQFRPEFVQAGIAVLEETLHKLYAHHQGEEEHLGEMPPKVFLFSGHMIDQPQRAEPRFPAAMESEVAQKIDESLDDLAADRHDLAIAAGVACGGDILFIEACLKREMPVEVYLPGDEADFIRESVAFAGDEWVDRFQQIRLNPKVTFHLQPERLGPAPKGDDQYSRNNRWALYSTLGYGSARIRLVVVWNGKGGDGPGGTGHMVQEVRRLGGLVKHLDTTKFSYWKRKGK